MSVLLGLVNVLISFTCEETLPYSLSFHIIDGVGFL